MIPESDPVSRQLAITGALSHISRQVHSGKLSPETGTILYHEYHAELKQLHERYPRLWTFHKNTNKPPDWLVTQANQKENTDGHRDSA